jgi:hypothetical protein
MDHEPLPQPPPLTAVDGVDGIDRVDGIDGIDGIDRADGIDRVDGSDVAARTTLRRGRLGPGWRVATVVAWIAVALGFGAVWRTSWTMGLSTWWLGPEASPRIVVLLVLPFIAPLIVTAAALRELPWVPYLGIGAAVACALIAWGDAGRVPGLAVVELALAAGGLFVSLGSLAGLPRPTRPPRTHPPRPSRERVRTFEH